MRKSGPAPIPAEVYAARIEAVHEAMQEGFPLVQEKSGQKTALSVAAARLNLTVKGLKDSLDVAERTYGLKPDPEQYAPRRAPAAPAFTLDDLPDDGEPDAEQLIELLKARHARRKLHEDAAKLRQVQVHMDGPIAVAFFGDPHVDDPGCAWGDLERDVRLCRDTPGMLAVDVGDDSNNWVGRLQRLYANQEVTSRQSLTLIEWLMTSLPWLLRVKGNHDNWNTDKGDPADYIHRLAGGIGVLEEHGARLQLNLPGGASFRMHVRHDFPGGSQFNPAHALVRETLFGHRDNIMACGHRHSTGYIPIWHRDPEPRLCHGFRVGAYKDFDHYAKEKGFQESNWARSMAAVIDPDHAGDPVRFIRPCFSLEEAAEYLTWRRAKWSTGSRAAA